MSKIAHAAIALALVAVFAIRVGFAVTHDSATFDEPEYITAGYSYLKTHELRLDPWHPPLAFVAAGLALELRYDLPFEPDPAAWAVADARRVAQSFVYADRAPGGAAIVETARVPSMLFGVATILLIGAWAARLWGARAGLFALALAAFDPNLIAHSAVATPDIMLTFFMLATMAAVWWYVQSPSRPRWLAIWACAALAFASKHVGFLLGPLIVIAFVEHVVADADPRAWVRRLARAAAETAIAGAIVVAIAVGVFGVHVFGVFGAVADSVSGQLWHAEHPPVAFLHGAIRDNGWWFYYVVVAALKTPIGTLILVAIAAAARRVGTPLTRATAAFVITPTALVVVFVMWSRIDLGIRLILPGYAFLIVLAARAATIAAGRWRTVSMVALAATIASSTLAIPNNLGYTNELARVAGGGARWLNDSNLDWGQDLGRLADYLRTSGAPPVYLAYFGGGSPSELGIRHESLPTAAPLFAPNADIADDRIDETGPCLADRQLIAISAFRQAGILEAHPDAYRWLSALSPIAEIGASIRIYDITRDVDSHVHLARMFGASSTGACEKRRAIALDPTAAARLR